MFVIVFIFSVSTSVILAVSSTSIAISENDRASIFYTSYSNLYNTKQITIKSAVPYTSGEEGQYTQYTISCFVDEESSDTGYTCKMISKLYKKDGSLVKRSLFPFDGYQYSEIIETNELVKTSYSNQQLLMYFNSQITAISKYLMYLSISPSVIEANKISYDCKSSFDLNSFSFKKRISVNFDNEEKTKIILDFNKNDYITRINYKTTSDFIMEINYEKEDFDFPNLNKYQ